MPQEAKGINELFEAGMGVFHLRKPDWSFEETAKLISNIDSKYHTQIAIHHHHYLSKEFDIRRLHFTESHRKNTDAKQIIHLKASGFILSTSAHNQEDLNLLNNFKYTFFGPVFDSISKKDYKSKVSKDFKLANHLINTKVIALGGINQSNINCVKSMSFHGVAVLGAIWENEAIERASIFERLLEACQE